MTPDTRTTPEHTHEWERGKHMADAFYIDGRILACAICGEPKPRNPEPSYWSRGFGDDLKRAGEQIRRHRS